LVARQARAARTIPRRGVDYWSLPRSTQAVMAAWISNRLARIVGAMLQVASD
jgi:hypothetical protein